MLGILGLVARDRTMEELGNVESPFVDDRLGQCERRRHMYRIPCSVLSVWPRFGFGWHVLVEEVEQAGIVLDQTPSKPTGCSQWADFGIEHQTLEHRPEANEPSLEQSLSSSFERLVEVQSGSWMLPG